MKKQQNLPHQKNEATHIVKAPDTFDACLQTTLVIEYLEKQHDSVIRDTVVEL